MGLKSKAIGFLGFTALAVVILAVCLVAPLNRAPLKSQPFYKQAQEQLANVQFFKAPQRPFQCGWAKINITPSHSMPMAGYRPRNNFESVHDSLFVRLMVLETSRKVAIINADLLLFPPKLKDLIQAKADKAGLDCFFYFSATHTHNSVGGWNDSPAGEFALGDFNAAWVNQLADKIVAAIQQVKLKRATMQVWQAEADDLVKNRIAKNGKKDGKVRGFTLTREDSTTACLFSFSAHATSIHKKVLSLSADYAGVTITRLEQSFSFAMFAGGMMGSHSFETMGDYTFDLVEKEGELLYERIAERKMRPHQDSLEMVTATFPIPLGPAQLRLSSNLKARNWAVEGLLGKIEGALTYLRLGDLILIGAPCDFSGELFVRHRLDSVAKAGGKELMITSFNGDYVGYITYDGHYDSINRAEVRELNWVGPYHGQYFSQLIKSLIEKDLIGAP